MRRPSIVALALLVAAAPLAAEVVVFTNGDRVSGTIMAKGTKRVRLRTPYGLLVIPRTDIERLVYDDGREEVLTPPSAPTPPPAPVVGLEVVVTGDSFWQAWDPQTAPADPSLRLAVALDGRDVVRYVDTSLDPQDLPGAVVNSFVFSPEELSVRPALGVKAASPEPGPGEVRLALDLPAALAGQRRLTLAYQVNHATSSCPEWRDMVQAEIDVDLAPGRTALVRLAQERGRMEYARLAMRHVETFRAVAHGAAAP